MSQPEDRRDPDQARAHVEAPVESVVADRETDRPLAEPASAKTQRSSDPARAFLPHGPEPTPPQAHFRQDDQLGPEDVVEQTVRAGRPGRGWLEVPIHPGEDTLERLRQALGQAGAGGQGITLVAGPSTPVSPQLVRQLQAAGVPSRVVRREESARPAARPEPDHMTREQWADAWVEALAQGDQARAEALAGPLIHWLQSERAYERHSAQILGAHAYWTVQEGERWTIVREPSGFSA